MEDETTTTQTASHTPMESYGVWALTAYLLVTAVLSCWLVYSLWSAKSNLGAGQAPPPPKECINTLSNLYPDKIMIGSAVSDFFIIGCGFTQTMKVKINGAVHAALWMDTTHIRAPLTTSDVAFSGTLLIALTNDDREVGSGVLSIVPATVDWNFSFWPRPFTISNEVQLLLMVLLTGAFSSSIYALKSLADYMGDNKLYKSWSTFYFIQPFEGAGAAFLL